MTGEQLSVQWKRGQFQTFYALMKIRVGGANPVDILRGEQFEYDGTILKYAGHELPSSSVRGAFRQGWVSTESPEDGEVNRVPPRVVSRNVAKAKSVNRDLANVQRGDSHSVTTDHLDEETVFDVSDRRPGAQDNPRAAPRIMTQAQNRRASTAGMRVETDEVEEQEGVAVGRVKTKASIGAVDITKKENVGLADRLDNTVRGLGKPQLRPQGRTIVREGVTIKTSVGDVDPNVRDEADDQGVHVASVRKSPGTRTVEGITIKDTSNIRHESSGPKSPVARPQNGAKASYKVNTKLPPKVRVARAIDPEFPADWDFTGKLADRMERVKKHGATQVFLEALYAAEGDQMRKLLEKTYPKQFNA